MSVGAGEMRALRLGYVLQISAHLKPLLQPFLKLPLSTSGQQCPFPNTLDFSRLPVYQYFHQLSFQTYWYLECILVLKGALCKIC